MENIGQISKAKAILIAKQRNTIWFEDDTIKFAELLRDEIIKEISIEELENILPMTKHELDTIDKLLDFNWDKYNNEIEINNQKSISITIKGNDYDNYEYLKNKIYQIVKIDSKEKLIAFILYFCKNNITEKEIKNYYASNA